MSNTITAFFKGRVGVCESLYQYDFGIVMVLDGIMFDTVFDAYFETTGDEDAIPVIGKYNRLAIPDSCLQKPGTVTLHIPIHDGQNDSEVEYIVTFKVIGRARPIYDGTPEQSTAIAKALAVMQDIQGDVSTWLDEHPEASSTVQDGSLTQVKFTETLKLQTIKEYVTPEMFGAKGDGVTDDTAALSACLAEGKDVFGCGTYKVTEKINIDILPNKSILINEIVGNFDDFVIALTNGSFGYLRIHSISNSVGGGVVFTPITYMQSDTIILDHILVEGTCVKFDNEVGVLDSYIGGGIWESLGTGYGIDATPPSSSYIGQIKFYVRRITVAGNWAINISSENGQITGLDFGYCSLEGSLKGIRITLGSKTIEPIHGTFRVIENTSAGKVSLKVIGDLSKFLGVSKLNFDWIKVSSVDLSEVVAGRGMNRYKPLIITGDIAADTTGRHLTNEAVINSKHLRFVPNVLFQDSIQTDEEGEALRHDWKTTNAIGWLATGGGVSALTMPSFWNGDLYNLLLGATTTVKFYFTEDEYVTTELAPGKQVVYATYDNNGLPTLRAL